MPKLWDLWYYTIFGSCRILSINSKAPYIRAGASAALLQGAPVFRCPVPRPTVRSAMKVSWGFPKIGDPDIVPKI